MPHPLFIADAFTDVPFAGNPAAVCLLDAAADADAEWMQRVAMEMNLSETAFLVPEGDAFGLRWFTPAVEVPLCGHATLASAHVLWETETIAKDRDAVFETASGRLVASRRGDEIQLDFPALRGAPIPAPAALVEALRSSPGTCLAIDQPGSLQTLLLELESEAAVRELAPDFGHPDAWRTQTAIVTAKAESGGFDFVSRFFAPAAGIPEDPVTGAAHCALAPFWSERLGRASLRGYQASARGGTVATTLAEDRVCLQGHATTVLRGELLA